MNHQASDMYVDFYKTYDSSIKFHKFCFMNKYGNIWMLKDKLKQFNQIFVVSIHFIQRNWIYRFFHSQYSYRQCFKQFRSLVIMLSVKIKLSYWALCITYMIIYSIFLTYVKPGFIMMICITYNITYYHDVPNAEI